MGRGSQVNSYNEYAYTKVELHNQVCEYIDKKLNHPERLYIQEDRINLVVKTIIEKFFLVDMGKNPFILNPITSHPLRAAAIKNYIDREYIEPGTADGYYENIHAAIQNFINAVNIDEISEEQAKATKERDELAFTLFKAADPGNLQFRTWDHVPRHSQNTYRNIADKAREVLKK
jgi:hypothetical protein